MVLKIIENNHLFHTLKHMAQGGKPTSPDGSAKAGRPEPGPGPKSQARGVLHAGLATTLPRHVASMACVP